jgi:hypothetical protein
MITVNRGNLNQVVEKVTQGNATIIEATGQAVVNSVQVNIGGGGGGLTNYFKMFLNFELKKNPKF